MGAFISFETLLLAAIIITGAPDIQWVTVNNKQNEWTFECGGSDSSETLWWILFIYHAAILIWTTRVALKSRKVVNEFSSTHSILASVIAISFTTAMITPVLIILKDDSMATILISGISQGILTISVLGINFIPKFLRLVQGNDADTSTSVVSTKTSNQSTKQTSSDDANRIAGFCRRNSLAVGGNTNAQGKIRVVYPDRTVQELEKATRTRIQEEISIIEPYLQKLRAALEKSVDGEGVNVVVEEEDDANETDV